MWTDLSTRHLLAFRAVCEEGTFGKAAVRLGFTQSAVSQQVAALEKIVGQPLFDRPAGPRPPTLTPAGVLLAGHVESMLAGFERAERELDAFARGVSGSLTIGTFQSVSARVLPLTLRQLREDAPNVEITLVEADPDNDFGIAALRRGDLDLTFIAGTPGAGLGVRSLGSDPHVALVPADYPEGPLALADLATATMIGQPAEDSCQELIDRGLERMGVTPRYAFRSHDNGAIQGMVAAGVGISICPLLTVDTADPAISIRPTEPEIEPRPLAIVWDENRTPAPIAQKFVELTAQICATLLTEPVGGEL